MRRGVEGDVDGTSTDGVQSRERGLHRPPSSRAENETSDSVQSRDIVLVKREDLGEFAKGVRFLSSACTVRRSLSGLFYSTPCSSRRKNRRRRARTRDAHLRGGRPRTPADTGSSRVFPDGTGPLSREYRTVGFILSTYGVRGVRSTGEAEDPSAPPNQRRRRYPHPFPTIRTNETTRCFTKCGHNIIFSTK